MTIFWERAVHKVNHILLVICPFVVLIISHFGFHGTVPGVCLLFTFTTQHGEIKSLPVMFLKWASARLALLVGCLGLHSR